MSMLLAGYAKNAEQSNVPQLPEKAVINNIFKTFHYLRYREYSCLPLHARTPSDTNMATGGGTVSLCLPLVCLR